MPVSNTADTIRILVATDSHVGYNERDATRGDDSWKTFHEVMMIAKDRDVDMILHAGDLFHENKPSRKSSVHVLESLRSACLGDKPCEIQLLSDASEQFTGRAFDHINFEDENMNVAIPFFCIHGNHDDPSGEGHFAPLDILSSAGYVNYFGRVPEADKIDVKPILLQKGNTKLALFGIGNVRDERLFRTFRDHQVTFFQPSAQKGDWFNLMCVHQNHHPYTDTGFLPEKFLPSFLDLIIWGHEHECKIDPTLNPSTGFHVMQPGSSVATSLVPGEAVTKYVSLLSISGKEFHSEKIRLKTVRPFIMREIRLQDAPEMRKVAMKSDNGDDVRHYLFRIIEEMIEEAHQQWRDAQEDDALEVGQDTEPPKPLVRLRVEYSAPDGGNFSTTNPQRFSAKFNDRVANTTDVVQFHRKKTGQRRNKDQPELPDSTVMAQMSLETVKVDKLIKEFLDAQSLMILPQNSFGDAMTHFVDKGDKHAMEEFVEDSLKVQVEQLVGDNDEVDDDHIEELMAKYKEQLEGQFAKGERKRLRTKGTVKPKPVKWDSDKEGHWEDQPFAIVRGDEDEEGEVNEYEGSPTPSARSGRRGRGGRGGRGGRAGKTAAGAGRKPTAPSKKTATASKTTTGRGKKKPVFEEDDEDEDVIMIDDDEEEGPDLEDSDSQALFVKHPAKKSAAAPRATATRSTAAKPTASAKASTATNRGKTLAQGRLNFGASQANGSASGSASRAGARSANATALPKRLQEPSEDEISDDDDAFEPPPPSARRR